MDTKAKGGVVRKELLHAQLGKRAIDSVKIMDIWFGAGQKGAFHKHPCPVVGYIVSGSCLMQVEGEPGKILRAGDAFYEPAETPIVHFDNNSETEPMRFIAYYLLLGGQELIEMLPPKE